MADDLTIPKLREPEYPEVVKRGRLSNTQKDALKAKQDYRCALCGIKPKRWEWDHKVEVWEGGRSDVLDNWQGLGAREECRCHVEKSGAAAKRRAKMNRLRGRAGQLKRRKERGPLLKSRNTFQKPLLPTSDSRKPDGAACFGGVRMKSRGFDKRLRKKFNGEVVPR